jgi:anti-sigma-K factor RskA
MNTTLNTAPERETIEELLPWHAAGTLSRSDAQRVEEALANDRELARRFELIREELGETIHLNESLGAPSARAMEQLFAKIDAEAPVARKTSVSFNLGAWLSGVVASLSPRALAYSATAAALAIVLQAAVITGVVVGDRTSSESYQTVSLPTDKTYAMVRFAPGASAADITKFLETHKASVVEGPKLGGMYQVRVAETKLSKDEAAALVKKMQAEDKIISFIAPKE